MVHRCLKMCVLSLCVAVSCGGRAFGVWLWCKECQQPIKEECWGSHRVEEHKDNVMPDQFYCYGCYRNKSGEWRSCLYPYDKSDIEADTSSFLSASNSEPCSFEEHVEQMHRV